jgi:hypothetical protein
MQPLEGWCRFDCDDRVRPQLGGLLGRGLDLFFSVTITTSKLVCQITWRKLQGQRLWEEMNRALDDHQKELKKRLTSLAPAVVKPCHREEARLSIRSGWKLHIEWLLFARCIGRPFVEAIGKHNTPPPLLQRLAERSLM